MKDHPSYHTKAATKCKVSLPSHHFIFHLQKNTSKTWGPLARHTYTHTHLLSLTLQHARITSLMQPSRKTLPSSAKMKLKGVQQPVEISHHVQNKIRKGPKSSSCPKWTVSNELTNSTAQNSYSVIFNQSNSDKSPPIEISFLNSVQFKSKLILHKKHLQFVFPFTCRYLKLSKFLQQTN